MSGDDRIFGPERWRSLGGQDWSWWDLWCCVIAVKDHDGDLTALAESIADKIRTERGPMFSSRSDDARLAQVLDLDQRLAAAGLDPGDLADRGVLRDRKITSRARAKFKANVPDGAYARTPAMLDLPRDRLERRARFGAWPEFPSDPAPFFDKFRPTIERRECTERQTRRVTHTLSDTLGHLDGPKRSLTDRLALYRAFYTAAAELADIADDSYGYLGDLWQETWLEYLDLDWRATGIAAALYWRDVCELYVWEDYGLDHRHEAAWFASATAADLALIRDTLAGLADEAHLYALDRQAKRATKAALS